MHMLSAEILNSQYFEKLHELIIHNQFDTVNQSIFMKIFRNLNPTERVWTKLILGQIILFLLTFHFEPYITSLRIKQKIQGMKFKLF
jgi:hypothetical protein